MSSIEPSPKRTPSDTEPEHAKQEKPVTQPDATTANAGGPSGGQGKGKKVAKLVWPDMSPKQRAEKSETKAQAPREALKPGAGPAPQDPGKAVQNAGAQSKVDRAPAPADQANPAPGHPPAHPGHKPQDQNVAGAKAAQAPREAFKPAAAPGPQGPVTAVQNAGAQSKVDQAPAPAGQANPAPGHPPAHPGLKPQDQNVAGAKAAQAPREELKPTAEAGAQGQVAAVQNAATLVAPVNQAPVNQAQVNQALAPNPQKQDKRPEKALQGPQNPGQNGGQNAGRNPASGGPGQKAAAPVGPATMTVGPEPRPVVGPAKLKRRHNIALLSFVLAVLLPSLAATIYLYTIAVDQYASKVGFAVRNEETSAASSLLGGLSGMTGGSTAQDSDALYEFIQSQQMVEEVDAKLNLRALFSKPERDVVFAFPADGSLEKLVDYWQRIVSIAYDGSTGLIQIQTNAFSAGDAQAVTQAIHDASDRMVHELSAKARDDATRYAREDLAIAEDRLQAARQAINDYRSRTQIVDPTASVQSQMGILNQLQSQMAEALIQLDMLRETTRADDPRVSDAQLKISVIEKRIAEERQKFGLGGQGIGSDDYATVVAEFERLNVDRDFAERSYVAALTALDAAKAEAQRQSRYLAVFISPTLAETAEYPRRALLSALVFLFLSLGWSIIALIYYSVRDRR